MLGGEQRKWALWQFCPTTEECLKNAVAEGEKIKAEVYVNQDRRIFIRFTNID
jgi:hypothetical protein